jgi:transcriptional regulator with XRE-family HTH domain
MTKLNDLDAVAIGARLRSCREATPSRAQPGKTMTQGELAGIVDTDGRTVSNWEQGRRPPKVAMLYKLHQVFNQPVDWILTGAGEDAPSPRNLRNVARLGCLDIIKVLAHFVDTYPEEQVVVAKINSWHSLILRETVAGKTRRVFMTQGGTHESSATPVRGKRKKKNQQW